MPLLFARFAAADAVQARASAAGDRHVLKRARGVQRGALRGDAPATVRQQRAKWHRLRNTRLIERAELLSTVGDGAQTIAPSAPWIQRFCATTTFLGAAAALLGAGAAAALTAGPALVASVAARAGTVATLAGMVRKYTAAIRNTSASKPNQMALRMTGGIAYMTNPSIPAWRSR